MELRFRDRREAGSLLARSLVDYAYQVNTVILALSESSIPVAFEVAQALGAPLDVFTVREMTSPNAPGTPFGVVTSGGVQELDDDTIRALSLPESFLRPTLAWEQRRLSRRERALRGERSAANLRGARVVLVDDGLSSGTAVRAAIRGVRRQGATLVVAATPVARPEVCSTYLDEVDDFACLIMPHSVWCADLWYEDSFKPRAETLRSLLDRCAARPILARGSRAGLGASAD